MKLHCYSFKLHCYIFYQTFHHVLFFNICVFQFDALSWKKGVSRKFFNYTCISLSFCQNFNKLHGYIVYYKFQYIPLFFYLRVFHFEALSWNNWVSCKIPIFANISFIFCQNFMKLHNYIVY